MNTLDLFAGVGGVRLGFDNNGFKCVFANDIEPKTKPTYDLNFEKTKLHIEDINDISINSLPHFDILTGGFPCQAFSVAGKREGFNDQVKGTLFFHIAEILRLRQPKAFFLENVSQLLTHDNGNTFITIQQVIKDLGYHLHYKVLKSSDFNVPQGRRRLFLVGFQDDVPFTFPEPIPLTKTIQDLLEPSVSPEYFIHKQHKFYQPIIDGVIKTDTIYQWRRRYVRENKSNLCPTIVATVGGVLTLVKTQQGVRQLTPRELFRFQGFPDTYQLPDYSYQILHHQVGNSVTVPIVDAIAKQMMRSLSGCISWEPVVA